MDYGVMLDDHVARGAKVTVACVEVPLDGATEFGIIKVDEQLRISCFDEKPAHPAPMPGRKPDCALASMGIYRFDAAFLYEQLDSRRGRPALQPRFRQGRHSAPGAARRRVFAHRFPDSCVNMADGRPYWRDVGTIDAFWEANIELTHVVPELNLYDEAWPMLGRQAQRPPAKFVFDNAERRGIATDSLVSGGCIISGAERAPLAAVFGARAAEGSRIHDSLVLPGVQIGRNVTLRSCVVDKLCVLPDGFQAGLDLGPRPRALPCHRSRCRADHAGDAGRALTGRARR